MSGTRPKKTPRVTHLFTVKVVREIRYHGEVTVRAESEDQAKELAAKQYDGPDSKAYWIEGDVTDETIEVEKNA